MYIPIHGTGRTSGAQKTCGNSTSFLNDDLQAFYMHSKNWKGIHCYEEQSLFFKICLELLYGYREH